MGAGIDLLLERQAAREVREPASKVVPGLRRGTVPLPPASPRRRSLRIIRGPAPRHEGRREEDLRRERLLHLIEQAEDDLAQGIFASAAHEALEAELAGKDLMPDRVDRLRLRRWRAIAYRKTRLLRDLFQIARIPTALLWSCWEEVEAFPELLAHLEEMREGGAMDLCFRPYDHIHLAASWIEGEIRATGKLKKPSPFGLSNPQSPPQWRTCLMVPAGLEIPFGRLCLFQEEAFVFMSSGERTYRIRENEHHRYGWHLPLCGASEGVYLMGRLADDEDVTHAMAGHETFEQALAAGSIVDLDPLMGGRIEAPRVRSGL